jgi:diguanylate cyclase (GGDEF)-like protein
MCTTASLDAGFAIAEDLRTKVAALVVRSGTEVLPEVTISCGIAATEEDGTQLDALLRAADLALYRAKDAGRNRSVRSTEHMDPAEMKTAQTDLTRG